LEQGTDASGNVIFCLWCGHANQDAGDAGQMCDSCSRPLHLTSLNAQDSPEREGFLAQFGNALVSDWRAMLALAGTLALLAGLSINHFVSREKEPANASTASPASTAGSVPHQPARPPAETSAESKPEATPAATNSPANSQEGFFEKEKIQAVKDWELRVAEVEAEISATRRLMLESPPAVALQLAERLKELELRKEGLEISLNSAKCDLADYYLASKHADRSVQIYDEVASWDPEGRTEPGRRAKMFAPRR